MRANAVPLLDLFDKKMRLEVPLFQRQYVWNQEEHWEPLWEDISRKFEEYIEDRRDAPRHFLGAIVLDQQQTPTVYVERRQVIDGQQRITTLQIFLAAFRDFCLINEAKDLAEECEGLISNRSRLIEEEADRFKIWPTLTDRAQFKAVMNVGTDAPEVRFPRVKKPGTKQFELRPQMIEAYLFFRDRLNEFFLGASGEVPVGATSPLQKRLATSFQSLQNALHVAVIDLEHGDDAQVIFETLNARGEPLLPADLLRNFIFLRASRQNEPQEELYEEYWRRFDDPFWREEIKQGRLTRPRSDLFMQHFLTSRQLFDIPVRHLFVEYKYWIQRKKPFESVREELATLARQGEHFRRIVSPDPGDVLYDLATFLDAFDVRTCYPLLLVLLEAGLPADDWPEVSRILQSYLLRRAFSSLTTKNYNRVFLGIARNLSEGASARALARHLGDLSGPSTGWPDDATFAEAWRSAPVYNTMNNPKLVHILSRLNESYLDSRMERVRIDGGLSVEHLLPQGWREHWPLPNGDQGMSAAELSRSDPGDRRATATRSRDVMLHTMGNLTIVTQPLNSIVSNSPWVVKRPELLRGSLLPINQTLHGYDVWDENAIARRSAELFEHALRLWPAPPPT